MFPGWLYADISSMNSNLVNINRFHNNRNGEQPGKRGVCMEDGNSENSSSDHSDNESLYSDHDDRTHVEFDAHRLKLQVANFIF